VEAWARSSDNPVGGWYGLRKGYRGRFAMYVPPVLEALGLAEVEHNPKNNRAPAERAPDDCCALRERRRLCAKTG
jgi:hypothetical protein